MSYQSFAYFYDHLMKDAPYDEWVEFVKRITQKYKINDASLLDIGCGTGELAIRLKKEGFHPTGIDLSEEMLEVAMNKTASEQLDIPYFLQDMKELNDLGEYDMAVIFCDSLNYLAEEQEVIQTFRNVYKQVKHKGLFLFDVHSTLKMSTLFKDQTYADNGDEISYIWNAWQGELPYSVEHELTFFMYDEETEKYTRYDEDHFQRTYPVEIYKNWIELSGFELLETLGDFGEKTIDQADRIFFVCRKS